MVRSKLSGEMANLIFGNCDGQLGYTPIKGLEDDLYDQIVWNPRAIRLSMALFVTLENEESWE